MRIARRILLTNFVLDDGTGTEMYVFDLALRLLELGRLPVVYSPRRGVLARRMQQTGIPVVERLSDVGAAPDVVHGHHTLETIAALLHFPTTPGLFVCHDCTTWYDTAPRLPTLRHYIGVDQACYDRLVYEHGVPPEQASLVPNGVHLDRFPLRAGLPPRPRSLLCFGHGFKPEHLAVVRAAAPDLHVESIGSSTQRHLAEPGPWLTQFDVVVARGRSAHEAIATGAATIVGDGTFIDGMVTPERFAFQQQNNFGRRLLRRPWCAATLHAALADYDPTRAAMVSTALRSQYSLDCVVDQLTALYDRLLNEFDPAATSPAELLATAAEWVQWASRHANVFLSAHPAGSPPELAPASTALESAAASAESATPSPAENPPERDETAPIITANFVRHPRRLLRELTRLLRSLPRRDAA